MVKQASDIFLDLPDNPVSSGNLTRGGGTNLSNAFGQDNDQGLSVILGSLKDIQLDQDLTKIFKAIQVLSAMLSTFLTSTNSELIVDQSLAGIILKDNQATPHYWRVIVNNSGVLTTIDIGTVAP